MEQEIGEATGAEIGRRRRWSLEDKRAVVELSLGPDCSVTEVAACFDVIPAQIYAWRRELREMAEAVVLEACGHLAHSNLQGCEVDHGSVALISFLVSGCDPPECFEAAEEVLDEVSPAIGMEVAIDLWMTNWGWSICGFRPGRRSGFSSIATAIAGWRGG